MDCLLRDGENGEKPLELTPYLVNCTFDIILESAMGVELNVQQSEDCEYSRCTERVKSITMRRFKMPHLWPNWLFYNLSIGKEYKSCVDTIHDFNRKIIKDRRELLKTSGSTKARPAFLDILLKIKYEDGTGNQLNWKSLQILIKSYFFRNVR